MQTVIRRYSGKGVKELFDLLEKRTADVEELCVRSKALSATPSHAAAMADSR